MNILLLRSSLRYVLRHPWQIGLAVLGVALGVAVVVAIDIANTSARRAFELSTEAVVGRATHQIVGSTPFISDSIYQTLRVQEGVSSIAPILEADVGLPDYEGRTLHVLGVDPFAEAEFRNFTGQSGNSAMSDGEALLVQPRSAVLSARVAKQLGLVRGDTLAISVAGKREYVVLATVLQARNERDAAVLDNLLIMDIAGVQDVLHRLGSISHIDVALRDEQERMALQKLLPAGVELVVAKTRSQGIGNMTKAFSLNLTALSLLALVVGMFLIYNTMTFSVVQRRPLIGRLRAMGVTHGEVFRLVLGEASIIGVVGTSIGVALGILLGRVLLGLVTQTINDLYFVVAVRSVVVEPLVLLKGVGLGIGATLLAALSPAREATHSSPRSVFSRSTVEVTLRSRAPFLAGVGTLLGIIGAVVLATVEYGIAISYCALLCVLLGFALLVPQLVIAFAVVLRVVLGSVFGLVGRMAVRGIVSTLSRTSVSIAALSIAISATIGVGVMVESFRQTVAVWLDMTLEADVYVSSPGLMSRRNDVPLSPALVARLVATPGIAETNTIKAVLSSWQGKPFELVAVGIGPRSEHRFAFKSETANKWNQLRTGNAVFVSEPFSWRFGMGTGDSIVLNTDDGAKQFFIAGVYADYASDIGAVLMSTQTHARYWRDTTITGASFYAANGVPVERLITHLQQAAGNEQPLLIRSNTALRKSSLVVFDRTFAVTGVLRLLTVIVAFIGILSALMALQLERAQEIGVLRATGMTPKQVWKLLALQTGTMGFISGVLAVPVGLVLAIVLIEVINKQSFGWSLQFVLSPSILLQAVVLAVVAAVLAGIYPAFKMGKTSPAVALRSE